MLTYKYTYDNEGTEFLVVSGTVQDGRSGGAYRVTNTYYSMPVETGIRQYLEDIAKRGQELHPEYDED